MLKALPIAAALLLLPASAALGQDVDAPSAAEICARDGAGASEDYEVDIDMEDLDEASPSARELAEASRAFGEKMKTFAPRAQAVCHEQGLTDAQREVRIDQLWAEYQPDIASFTSLATTLGLKIASEVMAEIDISSLVETAMTEAKESGALQGAMGVAQNSAWTQDDPEHQATLGLVAQYAAGEVMDSLEEAEAEAAEAPRPPARPAAPAHDHAH